VGRLCHGCSILVIPHLPGGFISVAGVEDSDISHFGLNSFSEGWESDSTI